MKRKLFLIAFATSLAVFIACFTITMSVLYGYFSREHNRELEQRAQLMASALNQYGDDFLELMMPDDDSRITLIAPDGTVLWDSTSGTPETEKNSDDYSVRLNDGRLLRLSDAPFSLQALIDNTFFLLIAVLALTVVSSLLLAASASKSIIDPINNIDLSNPGEATTYPELHPFFEKINIQNQQVETQLEELKKEHERQDRIRREFTANVSHELKTPLTSISGYAEILQNGMVEPKDISVFAGRIHSESQRLITLVQDIIKLSRLEAKEITHPISEVDLYDAASGTLEHLYSVAEKQKISMSLEGEHCSITGDRQLIDEMIYNLCDNSIKYNNPGGSVTVSVFPSNDNVLLTVSDTGIGIPEEGIDRVFERFYRMDKSHSKAVGGTGLGLSIVKHGAAYHNAEIICNSMVGVGTTITIVFPSHGVLKSQ